MSDAAARPGSVVVPGNWRGRLRDDRSVPPPPSVRPPQQDRTRETWQRVLDTGLELLEAGGWDALTISEVCRRCGISPPSLYARVDGRAGLFFAVWEYGIARVVETQRNLARAATPADDLAGAVRSAAEVMFGVFEAHDRFLRPVILRASVDLDLRTRGAAQSRFAIRLYMQDVPGRRTAVAAAGQAMFAECVVRIIYGDEFFLGRTESPAEFLNRIATAATATIAAAGPAVVDEDWPIPLE